MKVILETTQPMENIFIKSNADGIEIEGENAYIDGVQIYCLYEQINLISDGINWFIY